MIVVKKNSIIISWIFFSVIVIFFLFSFSSLSTEEPESPPPAPSSTSEDLFHIYDNYIRHVWEGLQRQQQEGAFCFLVLQAHCPKEISSDISKPHMVAHACIFANFCSKFFNVVNYDETGNYYLNLKDFTRETILTALAFMYTGIVKCSSKVLPDLRRLARHLGMEEMLIICNELLRKQKAITAAEKRELEQKNLIDKVNIFQIMNYIHNSFISIHGSLCGH